jgi:hypothetical protein
VNLRPLCGTGCERSATSAKRVLEYSRLPTAKARMVAQRFAARKAACDVFNCAITSSCSHASGHCAPSSKSHTGARPTVLLSFAASNYHLHQTIKPCCKPHPSMAMQPLAHALCIGAATTRRDARIAGAKQVPIAAVERFQLWGYTPSAPPSSRRRRHCLAMNRRGGVGEMSTCRGRAVRGPSLSLRGLIRYREARPVRLTCSGYASISRASPSRAGSAWT